MAFENNSNFGSMLKHFLLILLVLVLNGSTFAQANRDSLWAVVDQGNKDSNEVYALFYLANSWMPDSLDQAEALARQTLNTATEIGFNKGKAYAYSQLGTISSYREDYPRAVDRFKKCLEHSYGIMPPIKISFMIGNLGLMYERMGDYEMALSHMLECLEIREELKDTVHLAYACYNIGELHRQLHNFDEAFDFHERALKLRLAITHVTNQYNVIEDSYCAVADLHSVREQWPLALKNYRKALQYFYLNEDERNRTRTEASVLVEIAKVHEHLNHFDSAAFYFNRAVERTLSSNQQSDQAKTFLAVSDHYLKTGKASEALPVLLEAMETIDSVDINPLKAEIYLAISVVYERLGQYERAYAFAQKFIEIKEQLIDQDKVRALQEMQTRYETQKKEDQIESLNMQRELAEVKSNQQARMLVIAIAIAGLLVLLIVIIYWSLRQRNSLNKELSFQNQQKAALLKEIHHRVKNNLQVISSLLNLQSANLSDEAALSAMKEGQSRVKSIALIHQKLYQTEDISRVDFREYCEQLCGYLSSAHKQSNKEITIEVASFSAHLDIDTAVPLGLIVNELVTNSIKHAFTERSLGHITINVKDSEGNYILEMRDNGQGIKDELDIARAKTLGLKLIHMLSKQLGGKAEWFNDEGAVFRIYFRNKSMRKLTA